MRSPASRLLVRHPPEVQSSNGLQHRACSAGFDKTDGGLPAEAAVLPNLKLSTQTISLRLPQHLLDSIKTAANARDVPYQSLIKVWLQEKLEKS
jgi:hypothetical protein